MTDEQPKREPADHPLETKIAMQLRAHATELGSASSVTDSEIKGSQDLAYADVQIRVDTAAHQRETEKQRVEWELESDRLEQKEKLTDRYHQRIRDNCTYAVVVGLIVLGLAGSFVVAATATDTTRQIWAQGFATTLAGVVGGAFAGYLVGGRK